VAARDGVVTLSGHVRSYLEKLDAEKAAKRVQGVRALADELEIRLPSSSIRDDTDIAEAAAHALKWSISVPDRVRVTVSNGWLTLEGTVDWNFQRSAAEEAVCRLTGIKRLTNRIEVKAQVEAESIKTKIEAALRRNAAIDAQAIHVKVENRVVMLTGQVHSWAEREIVEAAAWSAPGVEAVDDELKIAA
jgi:osmotically-inducible protein OsmY